MTPQQFAVVAVIPNYADDALVEAIRVDTVQQWHDRLIALGGRPAGTPETTLGHAAEFVTADGTVRSLATWTDPDTGEEIEGPRRFWRVVGDAIPPHALATAQQ